MLLVAEVNFHPRNFFAEMFQAVLHFVLDLLRHVCIAFDIAIRIDLNDHVLILSQGYS